MDQSDNRSKGAAAINENNEAEGEATTSILGETPSAAERDSAATSAAANDTTDTADTADATDEASASAPQSATDVAAESNSADPDSAPLETRPAATSDALLAAAAADDEYAAEDAPDAPPDPPTDPVLDEGSRIGSYIIARVLRADADERAYLAYEADEASAALAADSVDTIAPGSYVTLVERTSGGFGGATSVIALGLRHPRLLFPRAILSSGARDYLVVEARVAEDGSSNPAPAPSVAEGARLEPLSALVAGAGLASALAYLHRNGIAHLHVSPDVIVVHNGRGYLGGMENAEYIGSDPETSAPLIARDANFLARSLGVLAGIAQEPSEATTPASIPASSDAVADETSPMRDLREVVAKGTVGDYAEPDEIVAACGAAVRAAGQTLPVLNTDLSQAPLAFAYGMATSIGMVRSQNQDACAAVSFDLRDDVTSGQPLGVFLVADGMGGEAHGEIASRFAARFIVAEMAKHFAAPTLTLPALAVLADEEFPQGDTAGSSGSADSPVLLDTLTRAVNEANRHVRLFAAQIGKATGATITAIATQGGRAALAHLGDSRAYLLRGNVMAQLSEDHSVLARLQAIDHPLLSDPDAFVPRSMLYRSLGQDDEANPDQLDFLLVEGDRLLICSDGLWDEIDGNILAQTLALAPDPQSCAERLVALANASGGHDNSTAVVIFVQTATGLSEQSATEETPMAAENSAAAEGPV